LTTVTAIDPVLKTITLSLPTTGAGTAGQAITVAGVVNLTTLTKSGAGTWIVSGANTYSGATTITAGVLVFANKAAQSASTLVTAAAASTVGLGVHSSDATYYNATDVANLFNTSLAGFTLDAASSVAVDTTNAGGSFDQTVALTGSRALVKIGTGTLVLSVANSHTGTTRIHQGTVAVTGSGVLGGASGSTADTGNIVFGQGLNSGALHFETVANLGAVDQIRFRNTGGTAGLGGALVYVGNTDQTLSKTIQCDTTIGIRLESNSVGGKLTFNGAFSQANRALYLGGTGSGDNTLGTAFTGSGGIIKRDAGTWILTGTNTYTGATTINGGTLALGASNVLANTAVSIGAATLATAAGVSDTVGTLDTTAAATIHVGSGATLAFAASSGIDWSDIPGTLNITGTFVSATSGNPGSLRFGTTNTGLTSIQLGKITAAGFTDFGLDADGYLTATAVAAGYSSWATANGAPGQTADLDHDNDGVSNGVEYFLGGPSGNTTGFTVLPGVVNIGGVRSVTWTMASTYDGTYGADFGVETSATLAAGSWATETLGGNVAISGDTVTYTFPAGPVKTFARLKVIDP
jgi:autotransporter-associated beta strand protein